jgi:hypothetical protein
VLALNSRDGVAAVCSLQSRLGAANEMIADIEASNFLTARDLRQKITAHAAFQRIFVIQ